jgi:hypothetical protein
LAVPGLKLTDISEVTAEVLSNADDDADFMYEAGEEIEPQLDLNGSIALTGATITGDNVLSAFKFLLQQQKESECRVLASIADLKSDFFQHVVPDSLPQAHPSPDIRFLDGSSTRKRVRDSLVPELWLRQL